jgi:hypothetical protein
MIDASREPRRARSAALFNNRHFADVAAAPLVANSDGTAMFTTRMVASSTGLADSVVRPVLHRLVDAQVLSMLPRSGGGRSAQYYLVLKDAALETSATSPALMTQTARRAPAGVRTPTGHTNVRTGVSGPLE